MSAVSASVVNEGRPQARRGLHDLVSATHNGVGGKLLITSNGITHSHLLVCVGSQNKPRRSGVCQGAFGIGSYTGFTLRRRAMAPINPRPASNIA